MKNQEIKDITSTFEAESNRLNQIIDNKEKMIDVLNNDLNKEKKVVLELTRSYEKEINDLAHDKSRLLDEVENLSQQNTHLNHKINDQRNLFDKDRDELEAYIRELKDELEMNQVNYVREKDRNAFMAGDLEREITSLKTENLSLRGISAEN